MTSKDDLICKNCEAYMPGIIKPHEGVCEFYETKVIEKEIICEYFLPIGGEKMEEITDLGKHYLEECRKKLHFRDLKIPKLTAGQVEHNIEMIASEDEDYILLFQEGFITNQELAELLLGKRRFD